MRQFRRNWFAHSMFSRSGWARAVRDPRQLIGLGRFATALFAAVAVWLDPTRPARDLDTVAIILAVYLALSLLAIVLALTVRLGDGALRLFHAIDLAVLGLLAGFSEELNSPFFIFFTFTIMSSALLWKMRGVLLTAAALQVLSLVVGWPDIEDGDSELNILIIRSCYTWVAAAMLGYFASYREAMRAKMAKLASWQPAALPAGGESTLAASLSCALEVLESKAVMIAWHDIAARRGKAMLCDANDCRALDRISPDFAARLVADGQSARLDRNDAGSAPIHALIQHFTADADNAPIRDWRMAAAERFHSRHQDGVVIILDPAVAEEIGPLMGLVTARVNEQLDQIASAHEKADAAMLKERAALARDLHDGVLQDLAAAALHLKVASTSGGPDPGGSIAKASTILGKQQRAIRGFVETSRPTDAAESQSLRHSLVTIGGVLERQWGCRIALDIAPPALSASEELTTEICLMMSEAVSNAVRHGQARTVTVEVHENPEGLAVCFKDDGCSSETIGPQFVKSPRSLDARVRQLGGTVSCFRSSRGYTISSVLPVSELSDAHYYAC